MSDIEQLIQIEENHHRKKVSQQRHHHPDLQLLYVLKGSGMLYHTHHTTPLTDQSLVFIPKETTHAVTTTTQMTLLALRVDETMLAPVLQEIFSRPPFQSVFLLSTTRQHQLKLRQAFRQVLQLTKSKEPLDQLDLQLTCQQLLLLVTRLKTAPSNDRSYSRSEAIHQYIETHYYEIHSNDQLAKLFNLSTRHVSSIYKAIYQLTPYEAIHKKRIDVACLLLLETDRSATMIGFEVGYESLATFYRQFNKFTDITPEQYRKERTIPYD